MGGQVGAYTECGGGGGMREGERSAVGDGWGGWRDAKDMGGEGRKRGGNVMKETREEVGGGGG